MSSISRQQIRLLAALGSLLLSSSCASSPKLAPFTTDGCSRFPDGTRSQQELWKHCCTRHDMAYWRGGTREERRAADRELRACVDEVRDPALAFMMYEGVRVGGAPWWPTRYRWGYGWSYGRLYRPLTEDEQRMADELLVGFEANEPVAKPEPE
jgi:hypothetical protein